MKSWLIPFLAITASAQVVPTTPTKFGKKNLGGSASLSGGGSSASTGVTRTESPTVVRTITYWTLSGARQWTSADGKPLLAKLIAFEDLTVEHLKGQPSPAAPKLPAQATVEKDGKVRLLVGQQPYELAVEKLSEKDRAFVNTVKRAVAKTIQAQ